MPDDVNNIEINWLCYFNAYIDLCENVCTDKVVIVSKSITISDKPTMLTFQI